MTEEHAGKRSVSGTGSGDLDLLARALDAMAYPAEKWQLIAHAQHLVDRVDDAWVCGLLWALPVGAYADLGEVQSAAALVAHDHPRRPKMRGRR